MTGGKKIIAIVGATGAQGGSLLRAILNEGSKCEFIPRALTRDATSEKAMALKKLGVEVVQADINNEEAVVKAIEGCYGMYCVTFYWGHLNPELETEQARTLANAAKKAGIKHVIWSTLEDSRKQVPLGSTIPTLMGKYNVPHFDSKGEADQYFVNLPTTYLVTSFYWENYIYFGLGPKKGTDNKLHVTIPMGKKRMPSIAVDDIGKCALAIFKHPEYINKRVGIQGESLTMGQIAEKMTKVLGKEIHYNEVSFEDYRKLGFPGVAELTNMFQFSHDCEAAFIAARSADEARKLNPELMSFEQWLVKNKDHFECMHE